MEPKMGLFEKAGGLVLGECAFLGLRPNSKNRKLDVR